MIKAFKNYTGQNDRRYGKPWIAKVTSWPIGKPPVLEFGGFVGSIADGGTVEIEAEPGDVVKVGQKDNRNTRKTENDFAIVQNDGTLEIVYAEAAREQWEKMKSIPRESRLDTGVAQKALNAAREIMDLDAFAGMQFSTDFTRLDFEAHIARIIEREMK